ncbi:acyltransferase [Paraburkholderia sp. BL10I2N1]|uniref:acyltransferase family protein n=1 Tax=Paraburkholderia sp. BL10I2N1 TaxID=1938796 RepID=UPI0010619C4B|nr:acyltransferase [Paraburkholderia sp. BL10I2N1]TDN70544.1 peptidoglycan/LPS O-acetylase OafA/YrhL [Paraburkholderia sp. BL10I2N1]
MTAGAGESDSSRLAYLDGLRGWAALIVVLCHLFPFYLLRSSGPSAEGVRHLLAKGAFWGYLQYSVATVGVVFYHFLTDGAIAVYVFFVLSGYVLSVGYVQKRRRELIADQALRRYIRLTVPIFFACCIAFCLMKLGLMYNQRVAVMSGSEWIAQFYQWSPDFFSLVKFALYDVYFDYFHVNSYVFVLWTMQLEFFGSFLIFCLLALFGELEKRWIPYGLALVAVWLINRDLVSFMMGLFIAELYQLEQVRLLLGRKVSKIAVSIMLMLVLLVPVLTFHYLARDNWAPVYSVAATIIVVSVMMLKPFQSAFSCRVSRFFGHISFSLYLMHPLVLCSFGAWYFIALHEYLSRPVLIASCAAFVVALSVLSARAFVILDSWGVREARRFSSAVLRKSALMPRTDSRVRRAGPAHAGESVGVPD